MITRKNYHIYYSKRRKHTIQRFKERSGKDMTNNEYNRLVALCKKAVYKNKLHKTIISIYYGHGARVIMFYRKMIVTFYFHDRCIGTIAECRYSIKYNNKKCHMRKKECYI